MTVTVKATQKDVGTTYKNVIQAYSEGYMFKIHYLNEADNEIILSFFNSQNYKRS